MSSNFKIFQIIDFYFEEYGYPKKCMFNLRRKMQHYPFLIQSGVIHLMWQISAFSPFDKIALFHRSDGG
jgi:hypothetical protein